MELNRNTLIKSLREMTNMAILPAFMNDKNYMNIYYMLIRYKSYKFFWLQSIKKSDRRKLMKIYNENNAGIFGNYWELYNIIMNYVCGSTMINTKNSHPISIDFNEKRNQVNSWFHSKVIKGNNDDSINMRMDSQIYLCLKGINFYSNYMSQLKCYNHTNSTEYNLTILLNILKKYKITFLNIDSKYLNNNPKGFHIIKANIMEYACNKTFDNNWC